MPPPTPIRGLSPASRLDEAARRILAGRLADVRHPEFSLSDELSLEGVHDMRVATRRLRAALQVFRQTGRLDEVDRQVKQLQDALGEVRDIHVQRDWLAQATRKQKAQHRAGLKDLQHRREALLDDRSARLRRALKRWSERTVPLLLLRMGEMKDAHAYGGGRIRRHLRQRLKRVEKRMARYAEAPDAITAHELRKKTKKFRYALEVFQPALSRTMEALLEILVPLQEGLGELHDADVRLELLGHVSAEAPPAEREAARTLLETVREERAQRAAEIARELQRWQSEQIIRRLRRMLG
ncbi:CHAD domain-containing protein [Stigmatella sp. ncwal1]|uniref:CHAD domain-containing protein n=1 Tax=Stigmatella ashevillensis TaxID=2995309 RepID=A0ABT5DBN9_9BACT|nr:CHAD domain-containing protein [Stigmatella ashevillena]MDC0710469.1 CHAD domain-containing protein [Stigmatella ashevillena]